MQSCNLVVSILVVLEFLRLQWRFPDMLLSRNDMVCSEWLSDFLFYLGSCMVYGCAVIVPLSGKLMLLMERMFSVGAMRSL